MSYRMPERMAWYLEDEPGTDLRVFLLPLPDGQPCVLEGVAALIWLVAADGEDAVTSVVEATGADRASVEGHVLAYLDTLVEGNLLDRPARWPT